MWVPGSVPYGKTTASWLSERPHQAQRPGTEGDGFRFSHSMMQHSNARASALLRGNPPANSAISARSLKNNRQSSLDQQSWPRRSMATISVLCCDSASRTAVGGGADASSSRSSPSTSR